MEHIYMCKELNHEEIEVSYNKLLNGSINQQIMIYEIIQKSMNEGEKRRNEIDNENFPRMIHMDPLSSCTEYSNGIYE
jgi:hypothetical protein